MKTMLNKHDFHTWKTPEGIFVSIHQENTLRKDFGPFDTQRKANAAAYKEWRKQQEAHDATKKAIKAELIKRAGLNADWAKNHLIVD
jgi:hypothetical protein